MARILAQVGANLYSVDPSTGAATQLTLPSGVTLSTTRRPRFALLNDWALLVNSPSENLAIDAEGVVFRLSLRGPVAPPIITAGSGTGLTANYQVRMSFVIQDDDGQDIFESPLSPISEDVDLTNQDLLIGPLEVAENVPNAARFVRRIYRNLDSGDIFYKLVDIPGNDAGVSIANTLADAELELLPVISGELATPPGSHAGLPRLENVVAWKGFAWGVATGVNLEDVLFYTVDNKIGQWPFRLPITPVGQSKQGIVAFGPTRDYLIVCKRRGVVAIGGTSNSNFIIIQISPDRGGCIAADTFVSFENFAIWLGPDGVYEYRNNAVTNITDDSVRPWFTTDDYLTRSDFSNCYATYNESRNQYEIHFNADGKWAAFNLTNRKWYGLHTTAAFTPSAVTAAEDSNDLATKLVGGTDGIIYTANSTLARDGAATAIDMDCDLSWVVPDANPNMVRMFQRLSILSKIESAGDLTITPKVGWLNASAGTGITHDLTTGQQRLRRLGVGRLFQLRLRKNTVNQSAAIYEIQVPHFDLSER